MDRQWEKQLREKMSQYSQSEPDGLWEDIMHRMDEIRPIQTEPHRKSKNVFLLPFIAAAAAVAAFFIVMKGTGASDPGSPAGRAAILADAAEVSLPEIPSPVPAGSLERPYYTEKKQEERSSGNENGAPTGIQEAAASDIHEDNDGRDTHISGEKPAEDEDFTMGGDYFQDLDYRETGRKSRGNRKRFSTSLSISNLTGSRQAYGGYGTIQPAALSFNGIPVKNAISAIPGNGILLLNRGNESSTEIRHRQPVRAGVTFKYYLSDKWGVETGLVYSYLASRMETVNSTMYASNTDQQLHYLGIPLRLSYNIFDSKYLTVYASAGGMAEKCISGSARTIVEINGTETDNTAGRINIKPLQWSVSAEAGVQGNINDFIGIYIEPGASWHFDNGSLVSTVYKEKPLNFNLEFGIRFSFR